MGIAAAAAVAASVGNGDGGGSSNDQGCASPQRLPLNDTLKAVGGLSLHFTSSLSVGCPGGGLSEDVSGVSDSHLYDSLPGVPELRRTSLHPEAAATDQQQEAVTCTSICQCTERADAQFQLPDSEPHFWDIPEQLLLGPQLPSAADCSGSSSVYDTCASAAVQAAAAIRGMREATKQMWTYGSSGLFGLLGDDDPRPGAAAVPQANAAAVKAGMSNRCTGILGQAAAAVDLTCWRKAVIATQLTDKQQDAFWKVSRGVQQLADCSRVAASEKQSHKPINCCCAASPVDIWLP